MGVVSTTLTNSRGDGFTITNCVASLSSATSLSFTGLLLNLYRDQHFLHNPFRNVFPCLYSSSIISAVVSISSTTFSQSLTTLGESFPSLSAASNVLLTLSLFPFSFPDASVKASTLSLRCIT
ncbi:hypothetical protein AMTR_s00104p00151970 [Amborella trichopoda]|uniref:Uncharacterized protein n=1 Tax=Amborella trichopoda TaxID=13333 RepID=W1NXM6_AMBTC|nr:hypothetical protein AMTR_s00104p00151970 [Amborella trichopoda]